MALEDSEELEAFFDAWYETELSPDSEDAWEAYDSALDSLRETVEPKLGHKLTSGLLRKTLGPRYGRWLSDNNLPRRRE